MRIDGKRIGILVEQDFEDVELTEPLQAMKDAEAQVTLIGSGTQATYTGKRERRKSMLTLPLIR